MARVLNSENDGWGSRDVSPTHRHGFLTHEPESMELGLSLPLGSMPPTHASLGRRLLSLHF